MRAEDDLERAPRQRGLIVLLALALLPGCGAGVVAVAASSGSSGGGSTPALNAFTVQSPKVSPAGLVLDASQAVRVALSYDAGQGETPMQVDGGLGPAGNEVSLVAGPNPSLTWHFATPLGTSFRSGVHLFARHPGGSVLNGGEIALGIGNDPPQVLSIDVIDIDPDEGEASGTTGIEITVADSSEDVVSVKVEFDVQEDEPDAGWQLARPALVEPGLPTPMYGITDVQVAREVDGGTGVRFFWNTDSDTDLKDLERDVRLRFSATDGLLPSLALESSTFRVDNNAPPIVQLDSGPLLLNPDERRGIPIPFRVVDEDGDLVEVVFQWRREGDEFPSLDTDGDGTIEGAEVDAILADPLLRQEHHVCTPYPHLATGRVVPIDASSVRLPELGSKESWILASGIVGRTLELLRPSSIPTPITPTWSSNPLVSPIAALPAGDGRSALVLDVPGKGRLREIELAAGAIVREIATLGPGIPSAMAFEHGEKAVLVALEDSGTWRIVRLDIASGALRELFDSGGAELAPVRGIASLGRSAAVATAGSSLLHIDYRDLLSPQLGALLTDLATPWGVVVDPLAPDRIYVGERDANRVLAIELDSRGMLPVIVDLADVQLGMLDAPEALAIERSGTRLLVVTARPGGGRQLVGLDLGAIGGNRALPIDALLGVPTVSSVATGSDELRLVCVPALDEILVAGGVEQRRRITAHSTSSQDVSVEPPFSSVPGPSSTWRLAEGALIRASPRGVTGRFVWDSIDAYTGSVFVRATARDDEFGTAVESGAPKSVNWGLEVEPFVLGGPGTTDGPFSIVAADLDGDGDLDLVSANANGNNLTVFLQLSPGSYQAAPLVLGGPGTTNGPFSVVAADLDEDGDLDLVSANGGSNSLTVFFQLSPGGFAADPLVLSDAVATIQPRSVAAADLDGDGDQDLVSANAGSSCLTAFFQLSPGTFSLAPVVLGGFPATDKPVSVAAADLDGDSDLDLVSANADGNDLTIFFQLALGSFAAAPLVVGGSGTTIQPAWSLRRTWRGTAIRTSSRQTRAATI